MRSYRIRAEAELELRQRQLVAEHGPEELSRRRKWAHYFESVGTHVRNLVGFSGNKELARKQSEELDDLDQLIETATEDQVDQADAILREWFGEEYEVWAKWWDEAVSVMEDEEAWPNDIPDPPEPFPNRLFRSLRSEYRKHLDLDDQTAGVEWKLAVYTARTMLAHARHVL